MSKLAKRKNKTECSDGKRGKKIAWLLAAAFVTGVSGILIKEAQEEITDGINDLMKPKKGKPEERWIDPKDIDFI